MEGAADELAGVEDGAGGVEVDGGTESEDVVGGGGAAEVVVGGAAEVGGALVVGGGLDEVGAAEVAEGESTTELCELEGACATVVGE